MISYNEQRYVMDGVYVAVCGKQWHLLNKHIIRHRMALTARPHVQNGTVIIKHSSHNVYSAIYIMISWVTLFGMSTVLYACNRGNRGNRGNIVAVYLCHYVTMSLCNENSMALSDDASVNMSCSIEIFQNISRVKSFFANIREMKLIKKIRC